MRLPLLLTLSLLARPATGAATEEFTVSCPQNAHPDLVTFLPGWSHQPLPTPWYSGYLHYEFEGQQVHTHYMFLLGEESPVDKILYWSNGGPGASSMFGLLTELGPLLLSDLSLQTEDYRQTGIPSFLYNRYTWTKLGHVLIIDQPAPVGFSYCNDTPDSHSCGGLKWNDELSSLNAYTALQTFYREKLPCFSISNKLPLYLTGESYGGIYIPTLARRILQEQKEGIKLPLAGFAVGDGCLGTETSICGDLSSQGGVHDYWFVLFMAGHHQIPLEDFHLVLRACHHAGDPGFLLQNTPDDQTCQQVVKRVKQEMGGFFVYSLYDQCTYRNGMLQGSTSDFPCGGGPVLDQWVLRDDVKKALHVEGTFFEVDNAEGDFDYTPTEPDLQPFYQALMKQNMAVDDDDDKVKILIYNGDTDPAITSFATANWTSHLGFDEKEHWRPWTVDGCQVMGGYITKYQGGLDFLTIRGAGHMVPTFQPEASFVFMKSWLAGQDYPTYDPKCTQPRTMASMFLPDDTATMTVPRRQSQPQYIRSALVYDIENGGKEE